VVRSHKNLVFGPFSASWLCALLFACGVSDGAHSDAMGSSNSAQAMDLGFELPADAPLEADAYADLMGWLVSGGHKGWVCESAVHRSAQGPNGVRIYVNDLLAASLTSGDSEHPVGAMSVRELYEDDLLTPHGFAVAIKTRSGFEPADNWFWLEVFGLEADSQPIIAEHAAPGCMDCHSEGRDFIRSTWPLP